MKFTILVVLVGIAALLAGCGDRFWEAACGLLPRPQHPKERPYLVQKATIIGGAEGIDLTGELTMPHGEGPFPGVNHFFQPAKKGGIDEMCEIETTIEPAVLEVIIGWLDSVRGPAELAAQETAL